MQIHNLLNPQEVVKQTGTIQEVVDSGYLIQDDSGSSFIATAAGTYKVGDRVLVLGTVIQYKTKKKIITQVYV